MADGAYNIQQHNWAELGKLTRQPPQPRLPSDRETVIVCCLRVKTTEHDYWTKSLVEIKALFDPPHTFFRCERVTFGFCCPPGSSDDEESVLVTVRKAIDRLLQFKYPQVTCDLEQIPSSIDVGGRPAESCLEKLQSIFRNRPHIPLANFDKFEEDIQKTAAKISKGLAQTKSRLPLCQTFAPIPPGLPLDQYASLLYQRTEKIIIGTKPLVYALRLTAGAFHHFCSRHCQKAVQYNEIQPCNIESRYTNELRRWEARSCILSAAVAASVPTMGWDAFRVYEVAIGLSMGLSILSDAPIAVWPLLGRRIAAEIEWPERTTAVNVFYDPVLVASLLGQKPYEEFRKVIRALPEDIDPSMLKPPCLVYETLESLAYVGVRIIGADQTPVLHDSQSSSLGDHGDGEEDPGRPRKRRRTDHTPKTPQTASGHLGEGSADGHAVEEQNHQHDLPSKDLGLCLPSASCSQGIIEPKEAQPQQQPVGEAAGALECSAFDDPDTWDFNIDDFNLFGGFDGQSLWDYNLDDLSIPAN